MGSSRLAKNYEIKLLQNGALRWEGPHSRGRARRSNGDTSISLCSSAAGGMLSGLLEEDEDGWYFAHLVTGQNEPIGFGAQLHPERSYMGFFYSQIRLCEAPSVCASMPPEETQLFRTFALRQHHSHVAQHRHNPTSPKSPRSKKNIGLGGPAALKAAIRWASGEATSLLLGNQKLFFVSPSPPFP